MNKPSDLFCNLPDWMPIDAWAGFVDMRKKIKKPLTTRAADLIIKKLDEFRVAGQNIETVLNNSVENSWQGVFEERERRQEARPGQRTSLPQLGKHGQITANNAQDWLESEGMDDTLEEKRRFAALITGLSDYYRSDVSRAVLGIYWEGLKQYNYEAIEKACWKHTQSPDEAGRWMPRNSDIIKLIDGGTDDHAQQAWSKVQTAIRIRGTYDDLIFDDPLIHRVVADMNGWISIGSKSEDEYPFIAREFQQRYRNLRQRSVIPEYPKILTGIANAANAAAGRPLLKPILVGNPEHAKLVVKGVPILSIENAK